MNRLELDLFHFHKRWGGEARKTTRSSGLTKEGECGKIVTQSNTLTERTLMLTGNNHEALPISTHGFLIGVELEATASIDDVMHRMVDAISYMDGVGRVEAEHIGEMGDYQSLEEEVLDNILTMPEPTKES